VVALPAGTSSGRVLRLRGQGLPRQGGGRGDLLVEIAIAIPPAASEEERKLWEQLARSSRFRPR
jgi:curved DNA-binding protein